MLLKELFYLLALGLKRDIAHKDSPLFALLQLESGKSSLLLFIVGVIKFNWSSFILVGFLLFSLLLECFFNLCGGFLDCH